MSSAEWNDLVERKRYWKRKNNAVGMFLPKEKRSSVCSTCGSMEQSTSPNTKKEG